MRQGALQGIENGGVQNFRGIPYAGAPVGEWRWRAPRPAPSWQGVRDASDFGPVCAQVLRPGYTQEPLGGYPMSEDCLHLSVWTPQPRGGAKLPVMVWLLPGGFRSGDVRMSNYDGAALARRGVVVVTFNYRLGIFGEFAHPALSRAQSREPLGNYNLMDQIAALRWVRANIAAFGGDPRNVTIFGMSAGGVSSNLLMASPAAAGLFAKAISESSGMRMSSDRQLRGDQPGLPSARDRGRTARARSRCRRGTDDVAVLLACARSACSSCSTTSAITSSVRPAA
ncbi:MAG: carboxylesterase family protein [Steroidobacteraceae bacterium]